MSRLGAYSLVLAFSAAAFAQAPAKGEKPGKPRFTVGKETTHVLGPLTKEGYVDYPTALNQRLSKGVTPENNAAVLLWKAFGPHPRGATMPPVFFKWLGFHPPERGAYFVPLPRYLKERFGLELGKVAQRSLDQLEPASERPWTVQQYPHLASWLKANRRPLALVVEGTRRSCYFNPLIPEGNAGLMDVLNPSVPGCREVACALTARAMRRIDEGRSEEAWQDLLACHRLGRLLARGATVIEFQVGVALDRGASDAEVTYLGSAKQ
jgi:hypothetical protein